MRVRIHRSMLELETLQCSDFYPRNSANYLQQRQPKFETVCRTTEQEFRAGMVWPTVLLHEFLLLHNCNSYLYCYFNVFLVISHIYQA
jgi:hypothetical protein